MVIYIGNAFLLYVRLLSLAVMLLYIGNAFLAVAISALLAELLVRIVSGQV